MSIRPRFFSLLYESFIFPLWIKRIDHIRYVGQRQVLNKIQSHVLSHSRWTRVGAHSIANPVVQFVFEIRLRLRTGYVDSSSTVKSLI